MMSPLESSGSHDSHHTNDHDHDDERDDYHNHKKHPRVVPVAWSLFWMRWRGKPWSLGLLLLFLVVVAGHRLFARIEGHKSYVHSPIHTTERDCPSPGYPTLAQQQQQQQQQASTTIPDPKFPPSSSSSSSSICLTTLTDEQEKSRLQKWVRWRNFDGLLELTWDNKASYANKHGYRLFDESAQLDRSRPPSWSKIKATRRLLVEEGCEWVWWVDADTVVMNSAKRAEDFLPASNTNGDLLLSEHSSGGFNAGGWWIRNSEYSLAFLDEWWNMKEYVKPPGLAKSGDNDAFQALLKKRKEDFGDHLLTPPGCTFNSFALFFTPRELAALQVSGEAITEQDWYTSDKFYHKGDLLAHAAGYNNKEDSIRMLLDLAE